MFGRFFKKKGGQATSADVHEILKLSTFGTAMSFSTGLSASRYSVSSSVGLETVFSIFLARELLVSEMLFIATFVERQLKVDSLDLTQDVFLEGYRMAISGVGFLSYVRELNVGRVGFSPEMVEPAVKQIVEVVQQAFNEDHDRFLQHQDILKNIPLIRKEDILERLVDSNGNPFIPLYVQVVADMGKMQGRDDWGNIDSVYVVAKKAVLDGMFMV